MTAPPLLSIANLRKSYGENVVLDDLSLEVDRHRCVVLIGASGSGKSTLLRCVNLLETVEDGTIELDGLDITDPRTGSTRCGAGSASSSSRSICFHTCRCWTT